MKKHDTKDDKVYNAELIGIYIKEIRNLDAKTIYSISQYQPNVYNTDEGDYLVVRNRRKRGLINLLRDNKVLFTTKKRQVVKITENKAFKPFNASQYVDGKSNSIVKRAFLQIISIFKQLFCEIDWNQAIKQAFHGCKPHQNAQLMKIQRQISHLQQQKTHTREKRQSKTSFHIIQEEVSKGKERIQSVRRLVNEQYHERNEYRFFQPDSENFNQSREIYGNFTHGMFKLTPQPFPKPIFGQQEGQRNQIDQILDPKDFD